MKRGRVLSRLKAAEVNMTSMIDVVFLLISFFTLVMNFSQAEQHEEIALPKSELAKPPEIADAERITLQVLTDHTILCGSKACWIENNQYSSTTFGSTLKDELHQREYLRKVKPRDVTIVIRGDHDVETGFIQRVIAACQDLGVDSFVLRAKQSRED